MWDKIKAQCPRGRDSFMALPTPEEIEELVCKIASSEIVEKEATEEVCKIIKEHFPWWRCSQNANSGECSVGQD